MEKIKIKIDFKWDGSISPLDFKVEGKKIQVMDIGRRWDTEDGKHILVMDFQNQTYHLFFQLLDLTWYLVQDIKPPAEPA